MKLLPLAVMLAAPLSSCASGTAGRVSSGSQWLVGSWVQLSEVIVPHQRMGERARGSRVELLEGVEVPLACNSGLAVTYRADGTYVSVNEDGLWQLEGERLVERIIRRPAPEDPGQAAMLNMMGDRFVWRVEQVGPDRMRVTDESELQQRLFQRCPQ